MTHPSILLSSGGNPNVEWVQWVLGARGEDAGRCLRGLWGCEGDKEGEDAGREGTAMSGWER